MSWVSADMCLWMAVSWVCLCMSTHLCADFHQSVQGSSQKILGAVFSGEGMGQGSARTKYLGKVSVTMRLPRQSSTYLVYDVYVVDVAIHVPQCLCVEVRGQSCLPPWDIRQANWHTRYWRFSCLRLISVGALRLQMSTMTPTVSSSAYPNLGLLHLHSKHFTHEPPPLPSPITFNSKALIEVKFWILMSNFISPN